MSGQDDTERLLRAALSSTTRDERLAPALLRYGRPTAVRQGRAFFYQGDAAESAYLLFAGRVAPVRYRADDSPREFPPVGLGSWLGLAELVLSSAYFFDTPALEPCEALTFGLRNFELFRRQAGAADYVAATLARGVREAIVLLDDEDPASRIVSFLLSRRRTIGAVANSSVSATQADIARAVGLTRETVNRHLKAMEEAGFVRVGRGEIGIVDWGRLEQMRRITQE